MSEFSWNPGGDLSRGGQWLDQPGWYHVLITEMQNPALNKDNVPIPNAAFKACYEVLAGTVDGQRGKTGDVTFFQPKPTDKNEGAWAKKKIDFFFVAVGFATPEQIAAKAPLRIDLQSAVGRQFVIHLEKEKEDAKYLSLAYADIYHVDDPAVSAYPKCQESLSIIDPALRKIGWSGAAAASTAAKPATATGGNGAASHAPNHASHATPASTVLDDL